MELLEQSGELISNIIDEGKDFLATSLGKVTAGATIGAVGIGTAVGISSVIKNRKKRKSKRKSKRRVQRRHRRQVRKTPRTAGKGKDRSHKRIRYTKRGQPYIITSSGRARFLKKSSAKRSHKMKGGRY